MAVNLTRPVGTVIPDSTPVDKAFLRQLMADLIGGVDTGDANLATAIRDTGGLRLTNVSGTGDAITADLNAAIVASGVTALSVASEVEYIPSATNTAANPTITIAGASYGIRGADGETWPAGGFITGRSYRLRRRNSLMRVVGGDVGRADVNTGLSNLATAIRDTGGLRLTNVAGTGDAITADLNAAVAAAGVTALSVVSEIEYIPAATNAAANPTITIAGTSYGIRGAAGETWPAGGFIAGRSYRLRRRSSVMRVVGGDVGRADIVGLASASLVARLEASSALVTVDAFSAPRVGGYLTRNNGLIASASATWLYADFIPVLPGQVLDYTGAVNGTLGAAISFYDPQGAFVMDGLLPPPTGVTVRPTSGRVVVPKGVGFFRAATANSVTFRLLYSREVGAPDVLSALEYSSGADRARLKRAVTALLAGSAMPQRLAELPGMGDSFTVGANATAAANRFLNRVAAAAGAAVINLGVGGTVLQNSPGSGGAPLSNNGRDRFRSVLTGTSKRSFALLAYGFNDARYTAAPASFNVAGYRADYREIIVGLLCESYRRDQILIVAPHYITDTGLTTGTTGFSGQTRAGFEAFVTAAAAVAAEFGTLYFDSYAHMRDNGGAALIDTDHIHPTNQGHEVIANGILTQTIAANERDAPAITGWALSGSDLVLSWLPVVDALSYEVAAAGYDSLVIGAPSAASGTQHAFAGLPAGGRIGMVRAIFAGGAGPWSVSGSQLAP